MDEDRREFLETLLETAGPSGFETATQRAWIDYVEPFADEVRTDDYGNAVAVLDGGDPEIAFAGHADEIGYTVRTITEDGHLRLGRIGGSDRTVSRGQHVTVHASDGSVPGVVGQTAIHLRDPEDESVAEIAEQHVDIGAEDREAAAAMVDVGDPITVVQRVRELADGRLSARGMDNRVGIWAAAEGLRRAAEAGADATVYAVSTVQEEVGLQGARMVGYDLAPDAVVAVDVTHATDSPDVPGNVANDIELGGGPVVSRGGSNHPRLVEALRSVGAETDYQLEATGRRTGTDADAFFTARGAIPSVYLGIPNRYMHTPVEIVDTGDLDATADLLGRLGAAASDLAPFGVDL
ncbi:M42 family peptidase [Halapricum sp. CBA1109]|uniref:M20/M25/M40 family metallo-hydrolase n=1 Tax=Halapricum sp. CBA1109 TaxID=2668068 RepID=UPI0012FC70EA|nr:M20/M25/M40 family metallo-hydrolase [Halapricum sp. CBA1109]MUV89671.1 M42 family peptidase [Halapricum sp. CBA1109]